MRRAHQAMAARDAAGCGWQARRATEAMLHLLADLHGVPTADAPSKLTTLETLRKALRHARVLDRKLEDHVSHVQNIGNRAAHAQPGPDLAVDLADATSVLTALDRVHARFLELLPDDVRGQLQPRQAKASSPGPALVTAALWAAAFAAPVVAFLGVLALLDAPAPPPTPDVEEPLVDPDALEALLADADEGLAPRAAPSLQDRVRDGLALEDGTLEGQDCTALQWARNGIWARHGLVFTSREAQEHFEATGHYVAYPSTTRRRVEATFSEADRQNLALLNDRMTSRGCPCPRPGKLSSPCPE